MEQVHCGAAHVNGDGVEEEDGVVLSHTGNISVITLKPTSSQAPSYASQKLRPTHLLADGGVV